MIQEERLHDSGKSIEKCRNEINYLEQVKTHLTHFNELDIDTIYQLILDLINRLEGNTMSNKKYHAFARCIELPKLNKFSNAMKVYDKVSYFYCCLVKSGMDSYLNSKLDENFGPHNDSETLIANANKVLNTTDENYIQFALISYDNFCYDKKIKFVRNKGRIIYDASDTNDSKCGIDAIIDPKYFYVYDYIDQLIDSIISKVSQSTKNISDFYKLEDCLDELLIKNITEEFINSYKTENTQKIKK